jgi:hypothetical protein
MRNKKLVGCIAAVALNLVFQTAAHSVPSKWEKVETSLSDLLNSGWQLMGIASNRAAYQSTFSPGGIDEETYSFSLTKNGKYIICLAPDPKPPMTNIGCRRIN